MYLLGTGGSRLSLSHLETQQLSLLTHIFPLIQEDEFELLDKIGHIKKIAHKNQRNNVLLCKIENSTYTFPKITADLRVLSWNFKHIFC